MVHWQREISVEAADHGYPGIQHGTSICDERLTIRDGAISLLRAAPASPRIRDWSNRTDSVAIVLTGWRIVVSGGSHSSENRIPSNLGAMGHGDEVALVDRNSPAVSMSRRLARLDGTDVCTAGRVILGLLPLDTFVAEPVTRMQVVSAPGHIPDVQNEFRKIAEEAEGRAIAVGSLERTAFYARAREAFAVIATSEARPYGCFLLTKGVINECVQET